MAPEGKDPLLFIANIIYELEGNLGQGLGLILGQGRRAAKAEIPCYLDAKGRQLQRCKTGCESPKYGSPKM